MRAASLVAAVALGACSPSIATGAYLCGAEEDCPDGQACNGADGTCVIPSSALPFACDPTTEAHEPDQDAAHAASLGTFDCVSNPLVVTGCLAANDKHDWSTFATRPECTTQAITVEVASALAFETVTVELFDATGGAKLATAAACTNTGSPETTGEYALCLQQTLTPGSSYTLHVTPTGDGDCAGDCAFNRYRLTATTTR